MRFTFANEVRDVGVRGVYFNIRGMTNRPSTDPDVQSYVLAKLAHVAAGFEGSPTIRGYHSLHAAVSDKPQKLLASPEGLLSFYRAKNDIPRINGIVDIYNSISIATGIAMGAHDLAHVTGDIALRFTDGTESFLPLGSTKPVRVPPREYAYVDANNDILCRLEVRQVEKTKITLDSRDVFFIAQAHSQMDDMALRDGARLLIDACSSLFGGTLEILYPPDFVSCLSSGGQSN